MKTNQKILKLLNLLKEKGIGYEGVRRPHSADLKAFDKDRIFYLSVRGDTLTIETHAPKEALNHFLETLGVQAPVKDMVALRRAVISLEWSYG